MGTAHSLARYPCHPRLAPFIEHYWTVSWDLPAPAAQVSAVLSHPAMHLTVEEGEGIRHGMELPAALVHGVATRRFEVELAGRGRVLGAKFRPGGFTALTGMCAADLTDAVVRAEAIWPDARELTARALAATDDAGRCGELDAFLLGLAQPPDVRYPAVLDMVAAALTRRSITTTARLAASQGLGVRTVQRLTSRYVGVGAMWMIRRYRLHDALTELQADPWQNLADLAHGLGWYDQAHFTRDFSAAVGVSPARYADQRKAATGIDARHRGSR